MKHLSYLLMSMVLVSGCSNNYDCVLDAVNSPRNIQYGVSGVVRSLEMYFDSVHELSKSEVLDNYDKFTYSLMDLDITGSSPTELYAHVSNYAEILPVVFGYYLDIDSDTKKVLGRLVVCLSEINHQLNFNEHARDFRSNYDHLLSVLDRNLKYQVLEKAKSLISENEYNNFLERYNHYIN